MTDFQKRRGYKAQMARAILGAGAVMLLSLAAYFAAQGAWRMYGKFTQAAAAREAGEARLVELEREHARATARVAELNTPRGIEAEVRERYGLARPGEGEIVVMRPEPGEGLGPNEQGFWEKLFGAFFVW